MQNLGLINYLIHKSNDLLSLKNVHAQMNCNTTCIYKILKLLKAFNVCHGQQIVNNAILVTNIFFCVHQIV